MQSDDKNSNNISMISIIFVRIGKMKINKHHIAALALCIYILAICILCFMNPSDMPDPELDIPGLDKLVHFMMFIPFPALAYLTIENPKNGFKKTLTFIVLIFITGCLLATGTEYIQKLTDYRSFEIGDIAADFIGLFIGSILTLLHSTLKKPRTNDDK